MQYINLPVTASMVKGYWESLVQNTPREWAGCVLDMDTKFGSPSYT